jgi:putative acetyltransferase
VSQFEVVEARKDQGPTIRAGISAAFGRTDEADLVDKLRADGEAVVELAAVNQDGMIGHILFSALSVAPPNRRVAALAPLAVVPEHQKQGVGSALVREGLARCSALGFDAIAVLGDVEYYSRFGFQATTASALRSVYSGAHYQAIELKPVSLSGGLWRVTYAKAFG